MNKSSLEFYTLEKPEFQEVPVKNDNAFFVDTRLPMHAFTQAVGKRQGEKGTIRKQVLESTYDLTLGFPLVGNIVYGTELAGINSKFCKKDAKKA
jgi:hypothetical protein